MKRTNVKSKSLASIGYDPDNHILEVEFRNGGIYQYFRVPQNVHDELMKADSMGNYYQKNIRSGGYRFRKVK